MNVLKLFNPKWGCTLTLKDSFFLRKLLGWTPPLGEVQMWMGWWHIHLEAAGSVQLLLACLYTTCTWLWRHCRGRNPSVNASCHPASVNEKLLLVQHCIFKRNIEQHGIIKQGLELSQQLWNLLVEAGSEGLTSSIES